MNMDILAGNWKKMKGKIQQQWGKLTDDEFARINGSAERLEGFLQTQYGYEREKAKMEIQRFIEKNHLH